MRLIKFILCTTLTLTLTLSAATRNDVLVLEAAEALQKNTQSIAREYLLSDRYGDNQAYKKALDQMLNALSENIQKISINTDDAKTKGLLSYFATKKAEIMEMLNSKAGSQNSSEIVAISEIFAEGSKSITKQHAYVFSKEEKMQMLGIKMQTELNEILKYHLAIEVNSKDTSYKKKLTQATVAFSRDMKKLSVYPYPKSMSAVLKNLEDSWRTFKQTIETKHKVKVPALLSIAGKSMQEKLSALSIYHAKKQ